MREPLTARHVPDETRLRVAEDSAGRCGGNDGDQNVPCETERCEMAVRCLEMECSEVQSI